MPLRLLPKYEIDKRRAEEERQRMEEGLQIAGRVDTLRETVASEEVAFEKYRTDRLKAIQEEIATEEQKKNEIETLVIKAKAEYERLTAPLDRKWDEVKTKESKLVLQENSLKDWEGSLLDNESSLNIREKEISEKEKQIEIQHLSATSQSERAKILFEQTKVSSEKLRIEETYRLNEISKKEEMFGKIQSEFIEQRDILIATLKEKEEELNEERKKITIINQQLADQRKTLERALARL